MQVPVVIYMKPLKVNIEVPDDAEPHEWLQENVDEWLQFHTEDPDVRPSGRWDVL